jgi:protein disulfide-isomerase A6
MCGHCKAMTLTPTPTPTPTLTLTRCGHCKAMKPAWNEFSKLHAKSTELLVGEVDCTAAGGEELCERFEVEGFPTLKFFEAGASPEPEPGPRPQLRP